MCEAAFIGWASLILPVMAHLLLLTNALAPSAEVLPALGLLSHQVRILPAEPTALVDAPPADVVLVDARRELAVAKSLCRVLRATGMSVPLMAVLTEGGLAGLNADWGVDDVLLESAGPAEVEARLRLAVGRVEAVEEPGELQITSGDVSIDEATYSARVRGRLLDLTYKEFELLKYLAQHPAALHPGPACSRRSGATTTTAAPAPSTSTCGACAPSSAPTTRCSSARCAMSATASSPAHRRGERRRAGRDLSPGPRPEPRPDRAPAGHGGMAGVPPLDVQA